MESPSLLAARPILNAFLVVITGFLYYFFTQLYEARMLFIKRKVISLVYIYYFYSYIDKLLLITTYIALYILL